MVTKGYQKGVYERVTKGIMGRNRRREERLKARPVMRMLWYG